MTNEARAELLEGALGSTLISFQTAEYARHFVQTCSRILSVEAVDHGCMLDDRLIRISSAPIGIDIRSLEIQMQDMQVISYTNFLKEKYSGKRLLVSRDKFDHIRGLKPKMLAYERFLADHPEWIEKVRSLETVHAHLRLYSFKLHCWELELKMIHFSLTSMKLSLASTPCMAQSFISPSYFVTKTSNS